MKLKRIQLGMLHMAVAMTLVPINSTLNRVMIKELALSATLVAILASLPFLFSPIQVAIGSWSDRHPVFGLRRTPYILAGLVLCVVGVAISPQVAFLMDRDFSLGILAGLAAFGAWGMGYNLSSVSYLSLASELSNEKERGRTIAVMWFMMIVSIIFTAIALSRMVDPYTPQALERAFLVIAGAALLTGLLGLIRLEPRAATHWQAHAETWSFRQMSAVLASNPVGRSFFFYLFLLLAAILGQDVLLEPFAAEAFGMTVTQTTRITSLWGSFVLVAIAAAGVLEKRLPRGLMVQGGNLGALAGFLVILASGLFHNLSIFYLGVTLLGLGTGIATVSNLSLMFDLTMPGEVGLYMGAWGVSNSLSRLAGSVLGGALRDAVSQLSGNMLVGYLAVFGIEALMLLAAMLLLARIDITRFRERASSLTYMERAALASE